MKKKNEMKQDVKREKKDVAPKIAPANAQKTGAKASKVNEGKDARRASWTYLSNHAHVLLCLAREGDATLRHVAVRVGITERAVQRIVADLESTGVLKRERDGRRNHYEVDRLQPLRHAIEAHKTVSDLLKMVEDDAPPRKARP